MRGGKQVLALAETKTDEGPFLPLNPSTGALLHIRCGSDIYAGLREAGVPGTFLEISDPVCQGPLTPQTSESALRRARADFIATTYWEVGDAAAVLAKLDGEAAGLDQLEAFSKIVLWFEHDLYDQAILIRLLTQLRSRPDLNERLFLITIGSFPGIERFVGLGQLSPEQLAGLWGKEQPVSQDQLLEAEDLWRAFREGDPLSLQSALRDAKGALPHTVPALRRHLQELPWRDSGLGLSEQLTLKAIAEGADTPGRVFGRLMKDLEPLPYLGDAMFWPILMGLARGARPAITAFSEWRDPFELTDFGLDVLAGRQSWLNHNRLDRWVGGLHLLGSNPPYIWDPDSRQAVAAP